MPSSPPNSAVMAASTGSEVTQALNRFITVLVDTHLGPNMEDLTRRVRTTELTQEAWGDKEQRLEQRMVAQQERLQSLEKALSGKASNDHVAQLQSSMDAVMAEQTRGRTQQEQLLEELNVTIVDIKSRVSEAESNIRAGAEMMQRLEGVGRSLDRRLEVMEKETSEKLEQHAQQLKEGLLKMSREMEEKAAEAQVQSLRSSLAALEEKSNEISRNRQQEAHQLKSALDHMTSSVSALKTEIASKSEAAQQLGANLSSAGQKIALLEQSLQGKADLPQFDQMADVVSTLQAKVPSIEQDLNQGAERMAELEKSINGYHKKVTQSEALLHNKVDAKSLQQVENGLANLQSQHSQVQQALQDKVGSSALSSLKSTLSSVDGKMGQLEQSLQEKASSGNVQQLKQSVSMLETKVAGVDQAVHDKVGAGQMQQLKSIVMGIQNQANSLEQSIQDKVGAEQVQQIKTSVAQTQAQLSGYEQQLSEKAPLAQLHALKTVLATVETKVLGCDQALQEKVDAVQWTQLNDAVQVIQKKVGNIERGVWEGMDCVQGLEGALTTLKGQVATVEHNMQEKVCSEDVHRLGEVVISLKGKVGSLEQNLRQGAEHVTDVEGAVVSMGKQLATVKQVFTDMQNTQGRMLTLELGDRDRKSRRLGRDGDS